MKYYKKYFSAFEEFEEKCNYVLQYIDLDIQNTIEFIEYKA